MAYSKALNRRKRQAVGPWAARVAIDLAKYVPDPEMGPQRVAQRLSAQRVIQLAMMELTAAKRETISLVFFEGYSLLEISRKRNETLGNTRHHFYRGMAALRSLLAHAFRQPTFRVPQISRLWALPNPCEILQTLFLEWAFDTESREDWYALSHGNFRKLSGFAEKTLSTLLSLQPTRLYRANPVSHHFRQVTGFPLLTRRRRVGSGRLRMHRPHL